MKKKGKPVKKWPPGCPSYEKIGQLSLLIARKVLK